MKKFFSWRNMDFFSDTAKFPNWKKKRRIPTAIRMRLVTTPAPSR
jgi:hypothetical protein